MIIRAWARWLSLPQLFGLLVMAVIGYLVIVPLIAVIFSSLQSDFLGSDSHWTLANFTQTATNPIFGRLMLMSLVYATSTAFFAMILGAGLGWLYARTDAPFKSLGFVGVMIPFIVPGVLYAISWVLLCSAQIGLYNDVTGALIGYRLFNIYSLPGMIFVETLHNTPLAFLMAVSIFSSMDSTLEEAGYVAGFGHFGVFRKITLRLAMPGLTGVALLIFMRVLSGFEVPQLIGVPAHIFVIVSEVYAAIQSFPPDYGQAAVLGVFLLIFSVVSLLVVQFTTGRGAKFATISGKSFRPQPIALGAWRWAGGGIWIFCFLIFSAGPLAALAWASLLPEYQVPSLALLHDISLKNYSGILHYPNIITSLLNSFIAALSCGFITMALTGLASFIVIKTTVKWRFALDIFAFLPIAMPGVIVGIGVLFWYLILPLPINLYGTLTLIVIALITTQIPYGMRYMTAGLLQIKSELQEAGIVSGASWFAVLSRIYAPLLLPSFSAGLIYMIIAVFRDVSTAIFLYTPKSEILSITVFNLWQNGEFPTTAALGVLIVALIIALFGALSLVRRHYRIAAAL